MPPCISIIIPYFNRPHVLPRALKSVINQTFTDWECLVIDDGSTKPCRKIINTYCDKRIRLIELPENYGVSYARNRGIESARGSFIALLDSDDEWLPGKLAQQYDYFLKNPHCNIIHTEEIWIRNGKRVNQKHRHRKEGGDIFARSLELCLMSPSSIMLRSIIFKKYGLFNIDLPVCEDYDLWLRILSKEECCFISTPLIIKYGGHEDQLSRAYPAIDTYRVKSLINLPIIDIPPAKRDALFKEIVKKTNIIIGGAKKRNLSSRVFNFTGILYYYSSFSTKTKS